MNRPVLGYSLLTLAVVCVLSLALVSMVGAQNNNQPRFSTSPAAIAPATDKDAANKPTPRMSDGHPSLTGFWASGGFAGAATDDPNATVHETTRTPDGSIFFSYAGANGGTEAAEDGYEVHPRTTAPYKPEYLAKVKQIVAVQ
jgi:hypothetical protein